jgi:hypothetical protein
MQNHSAEPPVTPILPGVTADQSTTPSSDIPERPPFSWLARDRVAAGSIAFALHFIRQDALSEAILETSVELGGVREPRELDAWRFFQAARLCEFFSDTSLTPMARNIGARIAMHVTGFTVVDGSRITCGSSELYQWRARQNQARPMGARLARVRSFPRPMGAK